MRSGIISYLVPVSSFTPVIIIELVPAPVIIAPIELRKFAKSTISGSFAAFRITDVPSTTEDAIIAFSVAPTLGKSRIVSHAWSLSAVAFKNPFSITIFTPKFDNAKIC